MAAEVKKPESKCSGCGRRTQGSHCTYPSNPVLNALTPVKRDSLHVGGIPEVRRSRASAIKARNTSNFKGGGSSGGWWEGNPRLVKVGTAEKGGTDIMAMISQRYPTKAG